MLRRIQMIEGWGRGVPLILENEPKTQFEEIAGIFIANFARPSFASDYAEKAAADNLVDTMEGSLSAMPTTTETTTKTTREPQLILSAQEQAVLQFVEINPIISQDDLATSMGLTKDGVRYHMDKLKKKGVLRRVGGSKGGRWETCQQGHG